MPTLYTLGYEKRSLDEYVHLLVEAGMHVVVDVRETAWSHKPGFSKGAFAAALDEAGIEYIHARFAGNPKALRAAAPSHADCLAAYRELVHREEHRIEQLDELLAPLLQAGAAVCLTCFERHPGDCHRGILAELWQDRGFGREVEHLAPEGCERLVVA